jgi:hypothetical protein
MKVDIIERLEEGRMVETELLESLLFLICHAGHGSLEGTKTDRDPHLSENLKRTLLSLGHLQIQTH